MVIYKYIYIYKSIESFIYIYGETHPLNHPSSRPQLSCCSKVGLWVKRRCLRGASRAPRPPMATATRNARWPWFDKPLGIGLKVRGAGGVKGSCMVPGPKDLGFLMIFYICCWLLMIPVIFCGFIHWKNIVHPHDLWVRESGQHMFGTCLPPTKMRCGQHRKRVVQWRI